MSEAIEKRQVYCRMRDFGASTMEFIESDWHHAYLTYFNLIPSQENSFTDLEMTQSDIIAIIGKYGSHPPKGNKYYRPIPDEAIKPGLSEVERKTPDKTVPGVDEKVIESLLDVMRDGAKKFKEHTGREMTYLEIRSLYG
jgi:hypothetical protein